MGRIQSRRPEMMSQSENDMYPFQEVCLPVLGPNEVPVCVHVLL